MSDTRSAWGRWEEKGAGAGAGPNAIPWAAKDERELDQMIAPLDTPIELRGCLFATHADAMDDRPMDHVAIVQHALGGSATVTEDLANPNLINATVGGEIVRVARSGLRDAPGEVYRMLRAEHRPAAR